MAKKSKGKQKQDEKAQTSNATSPVSEPVVQPEIITQPAHESLQPAAWGTPVEQGWPANANNEVHWEQGADSWEPAMQGGGGGWGGAESLLDPPANQAHGGLPTIYEQPSSSSFHESGQNRTPAMSVQETYSEHYSDQDPQHWDNLQNRTVNGTAAPSAAGSPVPRQQHISLAEAAEAAGRQHDRVSLASEARYQKEDKAPLNDPSAGIQSFMASPAAQNASIRGHPLYDPKAPKQLSTASAYAAQFDTKRNRSSSTKPGHAGQSPETPTKPGKVAWRDDRPLFEGARPPAPIPIDTSWVTSGGNQWSNRHRNNPEGSFIAGRQQPSDEAWQEELRRYRAAEQMARQEYEKKQAQATQQQWVPNSRQQPFPGGQPAQQQKQKRSPAQQNQSWQGWGKQDGGEEAAESDEGTMNGNAWNHHDPWNQAHHGQPHQQKNPSKQGKRGAQQAAQGWGETGWPEHTADAWDGGAGGGGGDAWNQGNSGAHGQDPWAAAEPAAGTGWGTSNAAWEQGNGGGWPQPQANDGGAWGGGGGGGSAWPAATNGWPQPSPHAQKPSSKSSQMGGRHGHQSQARQQGHHPQAQHQVHQAHHRQHVRHATWPAGEEEEESEEWSEEDEEDEDEHDVWGASNDAWGNKGHQPKSQTTPRYEDPRQRGATHQAQMAENQRQQQQQHLRRQHQGSGHWEAIDPGRQSMIESGDYKGGHRVHFSPKASEIWGGSPRPIPSKTLTLARQGLTTTMLNDASEARFVESKGAAFDFVANAFFGNSRLARERIHWIFPADKDPRVKEMLDWVQKMSFNLGTYGLMKFLERRERGAIFINTIFRQPGSPNEPALDYLTFTELQATMDKTLQESVAFYDPGQLVIVFVYLPSKTGNSVAIWRRKVHVPDSARLRYRHELSIISTSLRKDKDYVVLVDELPSKKLPEKAGQLRKSPHGQAKANKVPKQPNPEKKRKWWKFF